MFYIEQKEEFEKKLLAHPLQLTVVNYPATNLLVKINYPNNLFWEIESLL